MTLEQTAQDVIARYERCPLCRGGGEVWLSGRLVPCICDGVNTLVMRQQERIAELEAQVERLQGTRHGDQ